MGKPKNDLTNQKFGKLTVKEYVGHSTWRCECECGNETFSNTSNLTAGKSKSCGCGGKIGGRAKRGPKEDLTGKVFGRLTPTEYLPGGAWKCKCECGNDTVVGTRMLKNGHTVSCGCYLKEHNANYATDMTGQTFGFLTVIERAESKGGYARWRCHCSNCGNDNYVVSGTSLRQNAVNSCGCVRSLNEKRISELLRSNNIPFKKEFSFPSLRSEKNGLLRFDFAVFNEDGSLSHLIEFNGEQHYVKASGAFGEDYENAMKRDALKIEYCKKHNIELRIIRFDQDYTLEDLI